MPNSCLTPCLFVINKKEEILASKHTWPCLLGTGQSTLHLHSWQTGPSSIVWSNHIPLKVETQPTPPSFSLPLISSLSLSLSFFPLYLSLSPFPWGHYVLPFTLPSLTSLLTLSSFSPIILPLKLCFHGRFVPHAPCFGPNLPRSVPYCIIILVNC